MVKTNILENLARRFVPPPMACGAKLAVFADWVRGWRDNRDPERSIVLRYEEMLDDVRACLVRTAELFGLDASSARIDEIAAAHDFRSMSGGRGAGQADDGSFVRKGVAGDWANHFTPELKEIYKDAIGEFLIEFGYERDLSW